jgi:hypothetical protein
VQLLVGMGGNIHYTLADAARSGHDGAVRLLLNTGYDVNSVDKTGRTTVQFAVYHRHRSIVQTLIDYGANLDMYPEDEIQETPLIVAAKQSWKGTDIVRLLIEGGADVDIHGGAALQLAVETRSTDLCAILLDHGADINLRAVPSGLLPVEADYMRGSADVLEMLLKHRVRAPEAKFCFSGECMEQWMPRKDRKASARVLSLLNDYGMKMDLEGNGTSLPAIYEAVRCGNYPVLKELLKLDADMTTRAGKHGNLLHAALSAEKYPYTFEDDPEEIHAVCVSALLDHGFDMNSPGAIYAGPLNAAIMSEPNNHGPYLHPAVPLLKRGVRVPGNGAELLEKAVANYIPEVVEYLLQDGISIRTSVIYPNLLAAACQSSHHWRTDMFPCLLQHGADLGTMGPDALYEAALKGIVIPLEWLLEHGVDANAPSDRYMHALLAFLSVAKQERGYYETGVVEKLLGFGADLAVHGPAALELAIANGYGSDLLKLLGAVGKDAESDDDEEILSEKKSAVSVSD